MTAPQERQLELLALLIGILKSMAQQAHLHNQYHADARAVIVPLFRCEFPCPFYKREPNLKKKLAQLECSRGLTFATCDLPRLDAFGIKHVVKPGWDPRYGSPEKLAHRYTKKREEQNG